MAFAGLNWIAIILASVLGFGFGAVWYGILGKRWMSAAGLTEDDMKNNSSPLPFIFAGVGNLIMSFTIAGLLAHMVVDFRHGLITALCIWLGFLVPTMLINYSFQMRPLALTFIDAGHWLFVLLIIGGVIGYFGV